MSDAATMDAIFHGKYQLVFFTPEMIISKKHWRRLLGGDVYGNRLKALIIDEAHCVKKWYVFDSLFFINMCTNNIIAGMRLSGKCC